MDRRLIFPAVAITAWAQQPAQPPGAAEAEAALRARVDEFYKLQVQKKFRQAEAMVADDSKDDYYDRAKQQISGFSLQQVEMLDNNTRARVTVKAKVTLRAALVGSQDFELPLLTSWKVENGQWMWFVDPETRGRTPFGTITPTAGGPTNGSSLATGNVDIKDIMNQVTIDRAAVTLSASSPEQTVTLTNHLPGPVSLELTKTQMRDLSIELEKSRLNGGESSTIRFRQTGSSRSSGTVRVVVSPLNKVFSIEVRSD
jgi:hypothetical protein